MEKEPTEKRNPPYIFMFALGVLFVFLVIPLTFSIIQSKNNEKLLIPGLEKIGQVVICESEIAPDTAIKEEDLAEREVPPDSYPLGGIVCKSLIIGKKSPKGISKGKIVNLVNFSESDRWEIVNKQKAVLKDSNNDVSAICNHEKPATP